MKIGICVRTWGEKGGIGIYTRNVVDAMIRLDRKNEYSLFYQYPSHMGTFQGQKNVLELHAPARNKLIWDQVTIPLYAKRERVDVIFHPKFSIPFLGSLLGLSFFRFQINSVHSPFLSNWYNC